MASAWTCTGNSAARQEGNTTDAAGQGLAFRPLLGDLTDLVGVATPLTTDSKGACKVTGSFMGAQVTEVAEAMPSTTVAVATAATGAVGVEPMEPGVTWTAVAITGGVTEGGGEAR